MTQHLPVELMVELILVRGRLLRLHLLLLVLGVLLLLLLLLLEAWLHAAVSGGSIGPLIRSHDGRGGELGNWKLAYIKRAMCLAGRGAGRVETWASLQGPVGGRGRRNWIGRYGQAVPGDDGQSSSDGISVREEKKCADGTRERGGK